MISDTDTGDLSYSHLKMLNQTVGLKTSIGKLLYLDPDCRLKTLIGKLLYLEPDCGVKDCNR